MTKHLQADRVIARCRELARLSDVDGQTSRTYLSPAMHACNELVADWMREAGLGVRLDAAGNLRGLREGGEARVILASHLDTVPNAGAFDGPLGVVCGIEIAHALALAEIDLPFSLEVIGFSEEEGVRFGTPFIGSRAIVGTLDDDLLLRQDADGATVRDAILDAGLSPFEMHEAFVPQGIAYLEIHIEQGPVLEAEDRSIGVVTSIVGQSRYTITFSGKANHAGTTPMHLRHDAMAAAAEWIISVEKFANDTMGLVATVGSVEVKPGAGNVIAGEVSATLDVRSPSDAVRQTTCKVLLRAARISAERRGVHVREDLRMDQAAVPMDADLSALLKEAAGSGAPLMVSGAGHDAMVIAPHMPAAMLFVRSPGGLSHHPDEAVREEDVSAALAAGAKFIELLVMKERDA